MRRLGRDLEQLVGDLVRSGGVLSGLGSCVCDLLRLERDLGWLVRDLRRLGRDLGQLSRGRWRSGGDKYTYMRRLGRDLEQLVLDLG